MTIKKKIVFEIEMSSGASEADLAEHFELFVNQIISSTKDKRLYSWWNKIPSIFNDESYHVDIEIDASIHNETT